MQEAFRLGGWGMYPTLVFGCFLVFVAARYALGPSRPRLHQAMAVGALTFLGSCVGFVAGVINTLSAAKEVPDHLRGVVIVTGLGESLINIAFGLCLLVIGTLGVVAGLSRWRRDRGTTLVDPHA